MSGDMRSNLFAKLTPICPECGRMFNLLDEQDANEWSYGHDCEAPTQKREKESGLSASIRTARAVIDKDPLCDCGHSLSEHYLPDGGMEPCDLCDCETFEQDGKGTFD